MTTTYNSIFITLDNTPDLIPVATGFFTKFLGDTEGKTLLIAEGGGAQNLDAGTKVYFGAINSTEVTVAVDGTTLLIKDGDDILAQISAHTQKSSTLVFADGGSELTVKNGAIVFGGHQFSPGESIEGAALTMELSPSIEIDLDDLGGVASAPKFLNVDNHAYVLVDDVERGSNTQIDGFGADDKIRLLGVSEDQVQVSVQDRMTQIEFDNGQGSVSTITLVGVTGFFTNVNEFNENPSFGDIVFA